MSEKLPNSPETHKNIENSAETHDQKEKLKDLIERGEKSKDDSIERAEKSRHDIEDEAVSGKEQSAGDSSDNPASHSGYLDKNIRKQSYKKTLTKIQSHLPKTQRSFSKFVHQPGIERASEVGSKTIARPSGLLGAGFFTFIGTTVFYFVSRQYGYEYSFTTFLALIAAGFVAGLMLELILKPFRKTK